MTKIRLPLLDLEVNPELWDSLIKKFSVENQYEGGFIAKDFLELTVNSVSEAGNSALSDSLDFIKFASRQRFAEALKQKYRIGSEFADDDDANQIFDKAFISAEAIAMGSLASGRYSVETLIYTELYYWVALQLLRIDRGEYVDRKSQGNQGRLGDNIDLIGNAFASLDSRFFIEE